MDNGFFIGSEMKMVDKYISREGDFYYLLEAYLNGEIAFTREACLYFQPSESYLQNDKPFDSGGWFAPSDELDQVVQLNNYVQYRSKILSLINGRNEMPFFKDGGNCIDLAGEKTKCG